MIWALYSKSIISENGNRPVPPATIMILPAGVTSNYSPLPLGMLIWMGVFKKSTDLNPEVNLPLL